MKTYKPGDILEINDNGKLMYGIVKTGKITGNFYVQTRGYDLISPHLFENANYIGNLNENPELERLIPWITE